MCIRDRCEGITGNKMNYSYTNDNRSGDHIWYISDVNKFKSHYPNWEYKYSLRDTLTQMFEKMKSK